MSDPQSFLEQMSSEGWAGIDASPDQHRADMQRVVNQAINEALPVADLFNTPQGQLVLRWLMAKTILRPPSPEENAATTAEEYALLKARREGQNGVIFMILHALQVAQGKQPEGEA